jgi:Protein of unknown function (DUF1553)
MAHQPSTASREADPANRLLQHYPARRMEAETIRDTILATSGRLDPTLFGMSIASYRDEENAYRRLFRGPLDGRGRRSIYIKFTLMEAPRFLSAFNLPGGKVAQGRRDVTEVPAQALAMLNDPFVLDQAEVWSRHLVMRGNETVSERIAAMFRVALGREATPDEQEQVGRVARVGLIQSTEKCTSPVGRGLSHGSDQHLRYLQGRCRAIQLAYHDSPFMNFDPGLSTLTTLT